MIRLWRVLAGLAAIWLTVAIPWAKTGSNAVPMATDDRVQLPGWWPTKGTAARTEFLGPGACEPCHASKVLTQKQTPMAHAAVAPLDSEQLRSHERLVFQAPSYTYQITRTDDGSTYSVTDGAQTLTFPVGWPFGFGESGQTYILEHHGNYYESRVSYYKALDGLDFTPGQSNLTSSTLEAALGRQMHATETQKCFGCHTTASTTSNRFDPSRLIPGVTCEACHGPGAKHIAAMKAQQTKQGLSSIFDPGQLNPVDSMDFCGACHRTFADVVLARVDGIRNVRFQPYRLEKSQCWSKSGGGITCLACHNPHQTRMQDSTSYDDVCLTCHRSGSTHPGKLCPVSQKQCVSCHMPKYPMPGMHFEFTDHFIRVVRKGETYPD
jgi:predicted CXXCH cytochrome family protein